MLLGGNVILIGENDLDDLTGQLQENERIRFVGELPKHIVAIMGFNAYTVGLVTIMAGEDKTAARGLYQQIVELVEKLNYEEVKLPVAPYAGLVWIEKLYNTTFTCGLVFGKDQEFAIFHTDAMSGRDDAVCTIKELIADEVKANIEPTVEVVTDEDLEEMDRAEA